MHPLTEQHRVISIVRKCCAPRYNKPRTNTEWLEKYKLPVRCIGCVLQFLDLAEPAKRSKMGWKAKQHFFQLARNKKVLARDPDEPFISADNHILLGMLNGIATSELCKYVLDQDAYRKARRIVVVFNVLVLEGLGLNREECETTPLLREMLVQGVVRIRDAAAIRRQDSL